MERLEDRAMLSAAGNGDASSSEGGFSEIGKLSGVDDLSLGNALVVALDGTATAAEMGQSDNLEWITAAQGQFSAASNYSVDLESFYFRATESLQRNRLQVIAIVFDNDDVPGGFIVIGWNKSATVTRVADDQLRFPAAKPLQAPAQGLTGINISQTASTPVATIDAPEASRQQLPASQSLRPLQGAAGRSLAFVLATVPQQTADRAAALAAPLNSAQSPASKTLPLPPVKQSAAARSAQPDSPAGGFSTATAPLSHHAEHVADFGLITADHEVAPQHAVSLAAAHASHAAAGLGEHQDGAVSPAVHDAALADLLASTATTVGAYIETGVRHDAAPLVLLSFAGLVVADVRRRQNRLSQSDATLEPEG